MRPAHVLVTALLLGGIAAGSAAAAPVVGPLHESTVAVTVPAGVRSVVVDVDAGDVTVSAGAVKGSAHKRWDLREPTLTTGYTGGTLTVKGRCGDTLELAGTVYVGTPLSSCGVDITLAVPTGVPVRLLGDRVTVTGRRGAVTVRAASTVALTGIGPGALDATSSGSSLSLRSSSPARVLLDASSSLALSDVTTGALDLRSDGSSVSLTRVTGQVLSARASSGLSLTTVRARTATLRSDASTVSVTDTTLPGALVAKASNALSVQRLRAASATLTSDASTVSVADTTLPGPLWVVASNAVRVAGTTASAADLRSSASTINVGASPITQLLGIASNAITVDLPRVPARVQLDSSSSTVTLQVPRASYAVTAHSDSGQVTLHGIVVDDAAGRLLDLSASGDVTVN